MGFGFLEKVKDKVVGGAGELVDRGGGFVAAGLDKAGWESGARSVRGAKNAVANRMGADTDELELGQTEDKKELIHGSAGKLRSTAEHLTTFKKGFNQVGLGLSRLDSGGFKGLTGDGFRAKAGEMPKKWYKAGEAFGQAAEALRDFAGTVEWAQGQAQDAIDAWRKAEEKSEQARDAHNKVVADYNSALIDYNAMYFSGKDPGSCPVPPGDFDDPGPGLKEKAQTILDDARRRRTEAETEALDLIKAAEDAAPPVPSTAEQMKSDAAIRLDDLSHVGGGVINFASGVYAHARTGNALDPFNLANPDEYRTNLNNAALGIYAAGRDPQSVVQAMGDSFRHDPGNFIGQMLPDALVGTKGAGALRGAAGKVRSKVNREPPGASGRPPRGRPSGGTDPVDLATGRMFLTQTDLTLPGALPLVFRRQVESGYGLGRWFGPSWASTADQRLLVDAEGVVLLTDDGQVLAYPHPAPGVPTLPESGTPWPLEQTGDRGYTVTDPDTGQTRHFAPPDEGLDGESRLEEITDRNGHRITFAYDEDGTPLGMAHSGGYRVTFTIDRAQGRITALHLAHGDDGTPGNDPAADGNRANGNAPTPAGHLAGGAGHRTVLRYGYTGGDLTEVTNSSGLPLRFAYDDEHRVVSWTDTNDRRYDYVYDNLDRVVAEGGTAGHL